MAEQNTISVILKAVDQMSGDLKKVEGRLASIDKTGKQTEKSVSGLQSVFGGLGAKIVVANQALALFQQGMRIVGTVSRNTVGIAIDFEKAFTGVTKTVEGTKEELDALREGLLGMSKVTPVAFEDLARIAQLGGQLGVQTQNLEKFTKTIVELGVSTDLSFEDAATSLAQFANIMGTSQDKFENLAASIVGLGNNFATTEPEIVQFGLRIAAAGKQVGLTEGDIFGIATAMSSVGIEAEAGGTSVSKTLFKMADALEKGGESAKLFADIARVPMQEFIRLFRDDAAAAFVAFLRGLGQLDEGAGATIQILTSLELADQRQIRALLSAAAAADKTAAAVNRGNKEFKDGTAALKEYEKFAQTTDSQLKILNGNLRALGSILGSVVLPPLNIAIGAFISLANAIEQAITGVGKLRAMNTADLGGMSTAQLEKLLADLTKLEESQKHAPGLAVITRGRIGQVISELGTRSQMEEFRDERQISRPKGPSLKAEDPEEAKKRAAAILELRKQTKAIEFEIANAIADSTGDYSEVQRIGSEIIDAEREANIKAVGIKEALKLSTLQQAQLEKEVLEKGAAFRLSKENERIDQEQRVSDQIKEIRRTEAEESRRSAEDVGETYLKIARDRAQIAEDDLRLAEEANLPVQERLDLAGKLQTEQSNILALEAELLRIKRLNLLAQLETVQSTEEEARIKLRLLEIDSELTKTEAAERGLGAPTKRIVDALARDAKEAADRLANQFVDTLLQVMQGREGSFKEILTGLGRALISEILRELIAGMILPVIAEQQAAGRKPSTLGTILGGLKAFLGIAGLFGGGGVVPPSSVPPSVPVPGGALQFAAHGMLVVPQGGIPRFANGGLVRNGPIVGMIGEEGPELVARVKPAIPGQGGQSDSIVQNIYLVDQTPKKLGPNDVVMIVADNLNRRGPVGQAVIKLNRQGA